jgi:hypothetical protein
MSGASFFPRGFSGRSSSFTEKFSQLLFACLTNNIVFIATEIKKSKNMFYKPLELI